MAMSQFEVASITRAVNALEAIAKQLKIANRLKCAQVRLSSGNDLDNRVAELEKQIG